MAVARLEQSFDGGMAAEAWQQPSSLLIRQSPALPLSPPRAPPLTTRTMLLHGVAGKCRTLTALDGLIASTGLIRQTRSIGAGGLGRRFCLLDRAGPSWADKHCQLGLRCFRDTECGCRCSCCSRGNGTGEFCAALVPEDGLGL